MTDDYRPAQPSWTTPEEPIAPPVSAVPYQQQVAPASPPTPPVPPAPSQVTYAAPTFPEIPQALSGAPQAPVGTQPTFAARVAQASAGVHTPPPGVSVPTGSPTQAVPSVSSPPSKKKKPSGGFSARHIALSMILSLIAGLVGASLVSFAILGTNNSISTYVPPTATEVSDTLGADTGTDLSVNVAYKVVPSVVSISVVQTQMTPMGAMTGEGSGSGVIIGQDGYILTNYHVIEGGTSIEVTAGAKSYKATVVGEDPSSDLAVLKINAAGLPAIEVGTSSDLRVGQYVMAVGAPFGLSDSVTVGIISSLGRTEAIRSGNMLAAYANLIQTDAAVNPGNSGGALVDAQGRLIGINTFIMTTSGSSAGVGFAIPVDTALDIANQLIEGGSAEHSFLGVSTQTIDPATAEQFGLPVTVGAYIVEIVAGSPAEEAGLEPSDILVKIGDKAIRTSEDVFAAVRAHKAGETVTVELYRDDEFMTVRVTLESDSSEAALRGTNQMPTDEMTDESLMDMLPPELLDMLRQYGF